MLLSGDWLQLPNVDDKGYAFESESWDKCIDNVVYLTKNNTEKTTEGEVLDELGLRNVCCRRHMLTHVDIE